MPSMDHEISRSAVVGLDDHGDVVLPDVEVTKRIAVHVDHEPVADRTGRFAVG